MVQKTWYRHQLSEDWSPGCRSGPSSVVQTTSLQVPVMILKEKWNLQPLISLSGDSAELPEDFVQVSSSIKSRGLKYLVSP